MARILTTVWLLICSNTFMNIAWYGHLKFKQAPMLLAIVVSWLIAMPEYALQVPANRIGHGELSAPQLKIVQEVISICVFLVLDAVYLKEALRPTDWLAFALILGAVLLVMVPRFTSAG